MDFLINVLRVNEGGTLPKALRENLMMNAKYQRKYNVWLFEGDYEIELSPWIEAGIEIDKLGEVILETLAISDDRLGKEIKHLIDKDRP